MQAYAILALAILFEVAATSLLKVSRGFTILWPTLGAVGGYIIATFLLSLTLDVIPTGVAYAIWAGVGIVLISLVGWFAFEQRLDLPALLGILLIIAGVFVINVFSTSSA